MSHHFASLLTFTAIGGKMTPPNDEQADTNQDAPDFDKTVNLLHCSKHGITYLETEGCPECAKEKGESPAKSDS
jgi:hypothetical protein